jgi:hypothetical protein
VPVVEVAPDEALVERFAPPPGPRGVVPALSGTGTKVAAALKQVASDTGRGLVIMARGVATVTRGLVDRVAAAVTGRRPHPDEPTLRIPAASPTTPVRAGASALVATQQPPPVDAVDEPAPAVRQWVPRPSVRPSVLKPRSRPALPADEPAPAPAAPVTPRRPPELDEPVVPAVPTVPVPTAPAPTTPAPTRQLPPWSDWLDELDLAMSGDFDADGPDVTEGGTVISGPERFDVLLTVPLWPDVPLDTHPDRRAG